ncbi:thioredoxin-like protein, putative [Plasmodium knowlesi strain H]|uniref:Thioredoxin-like protein, putative n=3 Tax=Plasmodium knowlesi TaxID=5850 RepID=A0A1A7VCP2_PLAKH|nr:thioredoxin-like protein, putative [Plasmodium knowlesi strain H]OTN67590.1 putative Thioredoxin-like protein [Plasmodium knowlesi]CAA9990418.1 thioredoxin-like protein, putative [Plasmodium knowlesi strain H]SBO19624.1 thioredoxin-like protein, putative [Plasmodium knowlesi strain H]SBO22583.1 thioredoxin-like protein, putative [Plasmodium knowlesi strain H]VVS79892.1 thioredoxin-like protein, putative [Plasmodium knowlesi strain H]
MIKIFLLFIFQVIAVFVQNVNAVNPKNSFTISHVNAPVGWHSNRQRKFAYVDLRRNKSEEGRRNALGTQGGSRQCPLRKVSFAGLMGFSGLSIPLFLATYMIYSKIKGDNRNLTEAEKIMGKFLYKHENNLIQGNNYEEEKSYNLFYLIHAIYNNIRTLINFYMNVKKVSTKDTSNEYTILFFHSYNVDRFLHTRNIKTYAERLKEIYQDINKKKNVNIVYVPLDSKLLFNIKHFSNMNNWYSILFHDKKQILKMIKNYNIMNIPTMVLLDKNMNIINDNINYLLLHQKKDFPYRDVNHLTYINWLYDKNNRKYDFKKLNSDYVLFYFNNEKENKGDLQSLLKIKKKLAAKNINVDIIFVKDMEMMKGNTTSKGDGMVSQKEAEKVGPLAGEKTEGNIPNEKIGNEKDTHESSKKEGQSALSEAEKQGMKGNTTDQSSQGRGTNDQMENYVDDVYYLGEQENNAIYKLLLYDMFDVTFKPVCILVNKKGNIISKYIHVEKKEDEIASFIQNNYKSLHEKANEKNYMYKYENVSNLNNLNVFSPIFILFSDKLNLDLLHQYNDLIGQYNKNRKGKKINFYFLVTDDKKYEALKKLCAVDNTTQAVILDLFNQKMFKDKVNKLGVIENLGGKSVINKDKFFSFVNSYYGDDLYASPIVLTRGV